MNSLKKLTSSEKFVVSITILSDGSTVDCTTGNCLNPGSWRIVWNSDAIPVIPPNGTGVLLSPQRNASK